MPIGNIGVRIRKADSQMRHIFHALPFDKTVKQFVRRISGYRIDKTSKAQIDIYSNHEHKLNILNPYKVSVVIPNYNYEKYIVERIDSILFQTYPIYEMIILDDCSTDKSLEIIQEKIGNLTTDFPIRLICNEKNSGNVFAQWQKAFQEARGDYVWIAEADDSSHAQFLETVMRGFEDPETVISYCESLTMDENNRLLMGDLRPWIDQTKCGKWDKSYKKNGIDEIKETMCINNTIANVSSAVFRKGDYQEFFEKAKEFRLAGDWYVYMRVLESGQIVYNNQSLNYHRMQPQGMTLSTTHATEYNEIIWLQNYAIEHYPISKETRKKVLERRERERTRFGL